MRNPDQPKFKKLSRAQIFEIGKVLTDVCERGDDGLCVYKPDWSDKIVADKFGVLSETTVGTLRIELVGKLRTIRNSAETDLEAMRAEMAIQRTALTKLIGEMQALQKWAAMRTVQPFKAV